MTSSLTRSTPTLTTPISSSAESGVPPALDSTQISRCAFKVRVSVPEHKVVSRWVGSRIGGRLVEIHPSHHRLDHCRQCCSLFEICKSQTQGCVVYGKRHWGSLVRRMLSTRKDSQPRSTKGAVVLAHKRGWGGLEVAILSMLTTITSSPMTSISGFLKCLRAVMPAKAAQSNRFPASARKWRVRRSCQTYVPTNKSVSFDHARHEYEERYAMNVAPSEVTRPTFSPARIHSASLSTASVLLMLFSSNRVMSTSSSLALWTFFQRSRQLDTSLRHRTPREESRESLKTHRPAS